MPKTVSAAALRKAQVALADSGPNVVILSELPKYLGRIGVISITLKAGELDAIGTMRGEVSDRQRAEVKKYLSRERLSKGRAEHTRPNRDPSTINMDGLRQSARAGDIPEDAEVVPFSFRIEADTLDGLDQIAQQRSGHPAGSREHGRARTGIVRDLIRKFVQEHLQDESDEPDE